MNMLWRLSYTLCFLMLFVHKALYNAVHKTFYNDVHKGLYNVCTHCMHNGSVYNTIQALCIEPC